jgi:hypothetical protein
MSAHPERRDVRAVAARQPLDRFQIERRVARIAWQALVQRHRQIDELHASPVTHYHALEVLIAEGFDLLAARRL